MNTKPAVTMNGRERMLAAIEGRPLDQYPVMVPYVMLSNADHWVEVTGEPVWRFYEWMTADPVRHAQGYKPFYDAMPFDLFQPWFAAKRADRENTRVVMRDGVPYLHDRKGDSLKPVPESIHNAGSGGGENETRHIFDVGDIRERIPYESESALVEGGVNDTLEAVLPLFRDKFCINGGVVNTFYSCVYHVGMENFYCMLKEEEALVHEMSKRILENNIAYIRAIARAGGDAIYIDDATATSEMVSVDTYETFALPYLTEQVREIKRLGKKAVLVYFGGISDRVEQILSTGVDLLVMEASMKGFVNDYAAISRQIGQRCCLAGNLNPYDHVEVLPEAALEAEIQRQASAGRLTGRYVTSTGSPLTPGTSVSRIARLIEMGHRA